jgi:hypothetical protein
MADAVAQGGDTGKSIELRACQIIEVEEAFALFWILCYISRQGFYST